MYLFFFKKREHKTHIIRKPYNSSSMPWKIVTVWAMCLLSSWGTVPKAIKPGFHSRKSSIPYCSPGPTQVSKPNTARLKRGRQYKINISLTNFEVYRQVNKQTKDRNNSANVGCKQWKIYLLDKNILRRNLSFCLLFLKFLDLCQQYWSYSTSVCDYFYIWSAQILAGICVFPK